MELIQTERQAEKTKRIVPIRFLNFLRGIFRFLLLRSRFVRKKCPQEQPYAQPGNRSDDRAIRHGRQDEKPVDSLMLIAHYHDQRRNDDSGNQPRNSPKDN